jgi:uncharacterized protein
VWRRRGTLTLRRDDGRIVCESVVVADTFRSRLRGALSYKRLEEDEGVVLRPSWSIHTWFMRFPLDVVFVDGDQVVIRIAPELKPFRVVSCRGAREVIELRAGECERRGLTVGDRIAWAPRATMTQSPDAPPELTHDEPRGRVLVASRDARFVKLSRFLLEGRGIAVSAVAAPGELVDEATEAEADIVILDAHAPPGTVDPRRRRACGRAERAGDEAVRQVGRDRGRDRRDRTAPGRAGPAAGRDSPARC